MTSLLKSLQQVTQVLPAWMLHVLFFSVWVVLHIPFIYYGTSQLPFHSAYVGDEQSPVTGALQILQTKSLFAIFNLESLYYGPLFAIIALPPVIFDFISNALASGVWGVGAYKNHILYDWGGIIWKSRIIALLVGYLGIVALYKILTTRTVNPTKACLPVVIGITLLAANFYYFEYSSLFKHWIFMLVPLMWQLYVLLLMYERPERLRKYFIIQALLATAAFGITYLSLLSQIILLPLFVRLVHKREKADMRGFLLYFATLVPLCALIVAWNPAQVMRYLQLFLSNVLLVGTNEYTATVDRDSYALAYFAKVFVVNHLLIILSGSFLVAAYFKQISQTVRVFLMATSIFGVLYFVLAVAQSNHVSRYALPTIIALIILVAVLLVHLYPVLSKKTRVVILTVLSINIAYHVLSGVFGAQMMLSGPPERAVVYEILQLQSAFPGEPITVINNELLGWPHTTASYAQFAQAYDMADRPLFKAYERGIPPETPLLSVSYVADIKDVIELQSHVLDCSSFETGEKAEEGDYQEVLLYRMWTQNYYWQPSCRTVTQKTI